jgi:hypothetical protein
MYVLDTRSVIGHVCVRYKRVIGHICMCQIQGEWSVMYVCIRYKETDRSCMYVSDTRRVIGHVCMY